MTTANPYPNLQRTFGVSVSANLTYADAHAALVAADTLLAMFPEGAQVNVNVYTVNAPASEAVTAQQLADMQTSPTPAPDSTPKRTRTKKAEPAPVAEVPEESSPAGSVDAIDGEPAAVAGETIAPADQPDAGTDTTAVPTDDELRAAVAAKMKAAPGNRALIATLLGQAGVQAVTHVPEGARPAFLAAVNAL